MVSYKNEFFIFGGRYDNTILNDLWKFDTICNEWELIKESKDSIEISGRCLSILTKFGNRFFIIGGVGKDYFKDVYEELSRA